MWTAFPENESITRTSGCVGIVVVAIVVWVKSFHFLCMYSMHVWAVCVQNNIEDNKNAKV